MYRPVLTLKSPGSSLAAALLVTIAATACGPSGDTTAAGERRSLGVRLSPFSTTDNVELVDLTYPLSPDSIYWPTGSPFEHERLDWGTNDAGYWYASAAFASPGAPRHPPRRADSLR